MDFKTLCKELSLSPTYEHPNQLENLTKWCHHHISTDLHYEGPADQQYHAYCHLAEDYLDQFMAHIPQDHSETTYAFQGLNALQFAAKRGYDRFIEHTTQTGNQLNQANEYGMTPLHLAAMGGHLHTVDVLLRKGANPTLQNHRKQPPLYSALFVPAHYDQANIVRKVAIFHQLYTAAPSVINQVDASGDTILQPIITHGFLSLLSEILAAHPDFLHVRNRMGHFPIHTAVLNNQPQAVALLLHHDIQQLQLVDGQGRTSLHYAALYSKSTEMFDRCCQPGVALDPTDSLSMTPLLCAASADNQLALKALLHHGANAKITDYRGWSILHYAVASRDVSLAGYILNHTHGLVDLDDNDGHPPLFYAKQLDNDDLAELLKSHGAVDHSSVTFR